MTFEMFIAMELMIGVMARTTDANGSKIIHLLSCRTGQWIPVTKQQMDENDIPPECLFMVQEFFSIARIGKNSAGS